MNDKELHEIQDILKEVGETVRVIQNALCIIAEATLKFRHLLESEAFRRQEALNNDTLPFDE
jgi:hypothetical protein